MYGTNNNLLGGNVLGTNTGLLGTNTGLLGNGGNVLGGTGYVGTTGTGKKFGLIWFDYNCLYTEGIQLRCSFRG